ncbi:MAG: ABC transporter permease [Candidatus Marinimicrobia bacterium]|nr:ABC transporter permease [Candidatus Neomarinimicrobiota bacterium]MCF7850616.1 ABC transporter permease [Candidatus Neomarinimicrobiota bacterium]MCF7903650.1 ABC transporter permease [Candidatus Neomarinimicrobiota bacterium]
MYVRTVFKTLGDSFLMAIEAIRDNLLRSILTLLGIVIGVFAIISVMTAIRTMESSINSGLNIFGSDIIYVQKSPVLQIGDNSNRRKYWKRPNITYEMSIELRDRMEGAKFVSVLDGTGGKTIRYRKEKTNPNVEVDGMDEWGIQALNVTLDYGRNFIKEDIQYGRRIALLGMDVVEKLFPYADPIGKSITVNGLSFDVVGVMQRKGEMFGQSQDNYVLIPITTYLQYFSQRWTSLGISVKAPDAESFEAVKQEVTDQMRIVRGLGPDEENDFEVTSNDALIKTFGSFTAGIKLFAGAVSVIALVVAGIGIMNIMLVSVTERIKEIGIRKAIGATRNNILFQFLLEAVFLSLIGGIIGVALGVGVGNMITLVFTSIETVIPLDWVFIGLFVCSFIGIVFGIYPAYKAAGLDPIESLRYE